LKETYFEKYTDTLIRDKKWFFKIEYNKGNIYILKCVEGDKCSHKRKIEVKEIALDLPQGHYLNEISKNIFNNKIHELKIEENNQVHENHYDPEIIKKKFKEMGQRLSKFSKLLIQKLETHLKKQVDTIQDLKALLNENYLWHIPKSGSLSNYCHHLRKVQFLKDFSGSIGKFQDLKAKYSFDKAQNESDLIILDIQENVEDLF